MLQRSANPRSNNMMMDGASDSPTPSPKETTPRPETLVRAELASTPNSPLYGVGVGSPSEHSESGDSARERAEEADRREEAWIENIRVIEALRKLISERLERREYEDDEDAAMSGTATADKHYHQAPPSSEGLYPTLRADDD
jgi:hypothetical protein